MDNPINFITSIYTERYPLPDGLKLRISVVEDLFKEVNKYMDETNRTQVTTNDVAEDSNGFTCMPNTVEAETNIFISKELIEQYIENHFQFACTIFHELTHAIDFYNYCKDFCSGNYDNILDNNNYFGFKMWSEFNAKIISYRMYFELINGKEYDKEKELEHILNFELDFQNKCLENNLLEINSPNLVIYYIILYLGIYYCWEEMYPEVFKNGKLISKVLKKNTNNKVRELYIFLKNHLMYSKEFAVYNLIFEELQNLMLSYYYNEYF